MQTSSQERIRTLSEHGHWGSATLHSLLADNAARHPDREAIVDPPNKLELSGSNALRMTFAEVDAASSALAVALARAGIVRGDAVLVQLPNISELVLAYYALSKLGAIISPIAVQYGSHEIANFARTLKPAAMLTLAECRGVALKKQAEDALPGVRVWDIVRDLNAGATTPLDDWEPPQTDANDIVTLCWTSGTTGTPKGVPRSHNMWITQGRLTMTAGGYQPGERLLAPFPFINMAALGGFLFPSALLGCTLVLHHPLDPALYLQQLQEERINFSIAPPALLNRLAQQPELWQQFDFSALRAFGSGSVPLSPAMIEVVEGHYGKPVINFYGSNEGIGLFATPDNAPSPAHRASLFPRLGVPGMPFESDPPEALITQVIDPETGEEITQPGLPGELCIAGPGVFDGYLDGAGDDVFTADGLFRTGDMVEICGDPPIYYRIVGRCKDIINRGGTKISPSEIDTLLEGFPGLAEVAVCAYPDPVLEERICACVVPLEGNQAPTLEALCGWMSERGIAKFKLPERLEVFDALPRNPLGKIVRGQLQQAVSERGDQA
ncbi:MAG: class I adenylate-forming enzyme family protein [Chromatocurvus sp.]